MSEGRRPVANFWHADMVSSRLLQFEVWNRLHAYRANAYRRGKARDVLRAVSFVEMSPQVLVRALTPFPSSTSARQPVRTLDGLHLATMVHLRNGGELIELASYDERLVATAAALDFSAVVL